MLKAARVHGRPIMVIGMTMAAIIQPTAIHRQPKTIRIRDVRLPPEADMLIVGIYVCFVPRRDIGGYGADLAGNRFSSRSIICRAC